MGILLQRLCSDNCPWCEWFRSRWLAAKPGRRAVHDQERTRPLSELTRQSWNPCSWIDNSIAWRESPCGGSLSGFTTPTAVHGWYGLGNCPPLGSAVKAWRPLLDSDLNMNSFIASSCRGRLAASRTPPWPGGVFAIVPSWILGPGFRLADRIDRLLPQEISEFAWTDPRHADVLWNWTSSLHLWLSYWQWAIPTVPHRPFNGREGSASDSATGPRGATEAILSRVLLTRAVPAPVRPQCPQVAPIYV